MKKLLLIGVALLGLQNLVAQQKTFELDVVAEGNFGTPNGDVFHLSNATGTVVQQGPMYQNANTGATGFDVLQDYEVIGNKAVFLSKGVSYSVVVADYPSFETVHTFTAIGAPQTLVTGGTDKAYVLVSNPTAVYQIDLATNTTTPVTDANSEISSYSNYMLYANGFVYVAMPSKLVKINPATNTVVAAIATEVGGINGLEYDADSNTVWVLGDTALQAIADGTDATAAPITLTGVTNAGYLRFANNVLYFLSGKTVYAFNTENQTAPASAIYTSALTGTWDFAYGKGFDVDETSGDFVIGTAGAFAGPSLYEIIDGTTFQVLASGNIPGCIGANEFALKTQLPLSVANPAQAQFSAYPNPASDRLTFAPKTDGAYTVSLYNALGAQVRTVQATGEAVINVSDLLAGVYFAKLNYNSASNQGGVQKIMIAR